MNEIMVMDDDEITFYIFYTKAFWELEDDTVINFSFYFCLLFAYLLLNRRVSEILR